MRMVTFSMKTIIKGKPTWEPEWWHMKMVKCNSCGFIGEIEPNEIDENPCFIIDGNIGRVECPTCRKVINFTDES